jgi:site-specific recombinase XerD
MTDPTPNLPQKKESGLVPKTILTAKEFQSLAEIPAELEWFANINNPRTRRAYQMDLKDFMRFVNITKPEEFRIVTRAHVIAWRKSLERQNLMPATIRRKLSALSSLFDYLCEKNAVTHNPVDGTKRPKKDSNEGKTPAISDAQAKALLNAPPEDTLKGKRDRAILATFLYHALRCDELAHLKIKDVQSRRGVLYLQVHGKGAKIRYIPVHPTAYERIQDYLEASGHDNNLTSPLFRPMSNNTKGLDDKHLSSQAIYECVVQYYARKIDLKVVGFTTHSLRATAATNALEHGADIARVQEMCGHADISTTKMYDRRKSRPEDSATRRISY